MALNVLGLFQAALGGVVAAAGVVFWAGETNKDIHQNTKDIAAVSQAQARDHDNVVQLKQEVDDVNTTVKDIAQDVKALRQHK